MRKTRRNRTPKDDRQNGEYVGYKKVIRKSKAGIEYVKYVLDEVQLPKGFNHKSRKQLDAVDRRQKEKRDFYLLVRGVRMYTKNAK